MESPEPEESSALRRGSEPWVPRRAPIREELSEELPEAPARRPRRSEDDPEEPEDRSERRLELDASDPLEE
jgi:hypothetical protein